MPVPNLRLSSAPSDDNWRTSDHYRPFETLDRRRWAWLWLKRNTDYQAAAVPGAIRRLRAAGPHGDLTFETGTFESHF